MKHLEIKSFEHKGIKVTVVIDYDQGTIDLVEKQGSSFSPKRWLFSNRGLEYMNGWLTILDAMKFAITEAKKELTAYQDEQNKKKDKALIQKISNLKKNK
jgi:hypothetical protein